MPPLDRPVRPRRAATLAALGLTPLVGLSLIFGGPAPSAVADPSSPTPTATTPTATTPTATTPTATTPTPADDTTSATPAADLTATPTPAATATPVPSDTPSATPAGADSRDSVGSASPVPSSAATTLSLQITPVGSPVAGQFFEDIGSYRLSGVLAPAQANQAVSAYWYRASTRSWIRSATGLTDAAGRYSLSQPVGGVGTFAFRTTLGPPPGTDTTTSTEVRATVRDATLTLRRPASTVDAMVNPTLSGTVAPARAGVKVSLDVVAGKSWRSVRTATTDAAGRYTVPFAYGTGNLARYTVRASYRATNRARTEVSSSAGLTRVKVLNARTRATTSADVAKTYRSGCPVGPSKLRTIEMNFYGYDGRMHRGVIIIRTNLADDTIRAFNAALKAGYPIAKLNNPNVYGGNDPRQMKANNTSGFNCRKVVGNPLRQSPHSYGIAIDVNTVQNPYRDAKGKWWPSNGKKYIKRTPRKKGMLGKTSILTKQLRKDGFFWGGFWNPGRDYQHFEKR